LPQLQVTFTSWYSGWVFAFISRLASGSGEKWNRIPGQRPCWQVSRAFPLGLQGARLACPIIRTLFEGVPCHGIGPLAYLE
jgi:hypothetical protein